MSRYAGAPHALFARRGTVLVFVVAMLGLLFIAGAAFLRSVTFEAAAITGETSKAKQQSALDMIESSVQLTLSRSWLGPGRKPYTAEDATIIENGGQIVRPTYGEIGGFDPLLAAIEPYLNVNGDVQFGYGTEVLAGADSVSSFSNPLAERPLPFGNHASGSIADPPPGTYPDINDDDFIDGADADGDGVVDTHPDHVSSLDSLPFLSSDVVEALTGQLSDPETLATPTLAMKLVPHGGMANLNYSHRFIVDAALGGTDVVFNDLVNRPYNPQVEEPVLRNRMMLPPQTLSSSALHGRPDPGDLEPENAGDLAAYLFPQSPTPETNESFQWWNYPQAKVGDDTTSGGLAEWLNRMDPNVPTDYDRRHLVTTLSEDDLFVRGVFDAATGQDRIELMLTDYDPTQDDLWNAWNGAYALDSYPFGLPPDDPRKGRIQLSLPWIENELLKTVGGISSGLDGFAANYNPFAMPPPGPRNLKQEAALAAVLLIQDTFLLILQNKLGGAFGNDSGQTTTIDIPLTAASLTANLIDFADNDVAGPGNDVPTPVVVRNWGEAWTPTLYLTNPVVYGLEQQPYITELYANLLVDTTQGDRVDQSATGSVYGIEIYNPYSEPLSLAGYSIDDGVNGPIPIPALPPPGIAPYSYLVFTNHDSSSANTNKIVGAINPLPSGNMRFVTDGATPLAQPVKLTRTVSYPLWGAMTTIELDRFQFDDEILLDEESLFTFLDDIINSQDGFHEGSAQRDTSPTYAGDGSTTQQWTWRATVPKFGASYVNSTGSWAPFAETIRTPNPGPNNFVDPTIRPVQVDFADTGALADRLNPMGQTVPGAFSTTGSLLLTMRHANRDIADPTNPGPFTMWLAADGSGATPNPTGDESTVIDNGRMPVFDPVGDHGWRASNGLAPPTFTAQPYDGLNALPWGQYVFDYFTALPLANGGGDVVGSPLPTYPTQWPGVDESGARVSGRININAAPWSVLAGLPLVPAPKMPGALNVLPAGSVQRAFAQQIQETVYYDLDGDGTMNDEVPIGPELAQAIVAYRETRQIPVGSVSPGAGQSGDYGLDGFRVDSDNVANETMRRGPGFLSVGELMEVRHRDSITDNTATNFQVSADVNDPANQITLWRMDSGVLNRPAAGQDYVSAVAMMVALGDWATTRGHVFTLYGSIQGDASTDHTLRFQETLNRLDGYLNGGLPEVVGERIVE